MVWSNMTCCCHSPCSTAVLDFFCLHRVDISAKAFALPGSLVMKRVRGLGDDRREMKKRHQDRQIKIALQVNMLSLALFPKVERDYIMLLMAKYVQRGEAKTLKIVGKDRKR